MKIKVAIIGFGKIGRLRYKILKKNKFVEIISIYDPSKISNRNNIFVSKPDLIINNNEIDAVFVSTPNFLNYYYTNKLICKKKYVFCEKPPAIKISELKKIIKNEKKYKKQVMYGFNHRHHESIKKMLDLIKKGKFGKILWMRGRYGKSVDKNFFNNWRSNKKKAGGGILIDQGIHMLDLLNVFSNGFDVVKSIVSNSYWNLDIEDNVFAILQNKKNNISASLHSTITQWRHLFSLEIFMTNGYMVLNGLKTSSNSYGKEELTVAKSRTTLPRAISVKEKKFIFKIDNSFKNETDIFINSILKKKQFHTCNSNEALEIMKLLKKIYNDG
tara:strand:+ start:791 stop:1777 length:987 start_codon:yes stop_codon:yes gene_type:complete